MRKATHFCLSPAALLLALAVLSAAGAMTCRAAAWEARVIDADTGRPLPFASVRTQGGLRSVTNAEGLFSIGCDSLESVSVSFVGYSPLTVPAMAVSGSLRLHPMAVSLSEVVVYPASKVVRAGNKAKAVADGILTLPMVLPPTVAGFFLLLLFCSLMQEVYGFGSTLYYEIYFRWFVG